MKKVWMPLFVISAFALTLSCGLGNPLAFAQQDLIGVWNELKDELRIKKNAFETMKSFNL